MKKATYFLLIGLVGAMHLSAMVAQEPLGQVSQRVQEIDKRITDIARDKGVKAALATAASTVCIHAGHVVAEDVTNKLLLGGCYFPGLVLLACGIYQGRKYVDGRLKLIGEKELLLNS
jgi:hypothetical protein